MISIFVRKVSFLIFFTELFGLGPSYVTYVKRYYELGAYHTVADAYICWYIYVLMCKQKYIDILKSVGLIYVDM